MVVKKIWICSTTLPGSASLEQEHKSCIAEALYSFSSEFSHPQVDINGIIPLLSGFFNPIPYYLQDCMKWMQGFYVP